MKKALIYALALALAFSLTACGQPKTEQPTDPAPSTSAPEPIATPEPIKDTAPEPEPEQTPAAPVETEDTQRPEETEPQEAEQVQLFTEVNETVYATGTVNIRASYTADSDKLGSLSAGESVTRTGIAIEGTEAEGWSRVVLFDGTTAYISNNYLSTTKPVAQQPSGGSTQGKPSGQTQQQQPTQQQTQQTQQPQQTQQTPQPSGGDSDAELAARKEAFINGMEQMFTEHGYNADGCDHEWTQEEKEALIKAVQIEGG
jgi:uncharacterized protein YgiM (DUF1202 family)